VEQIMHQSPWYQSIQPDDEIQMEDDEIQKLLRTARSLILDGHWCQGCLTTDSVNTPAKISEEHACHYCAVGAIRRANKELSGSLFFAGQRRQRRYQKAIRCLYTVICDTANISGTSQTVVDQEMVVMFWNDLHRYDEVLDGFNRAITIAPYVEVV